MKNMRKHLNWIMHRKYAKNYRHNMNIITFLKSNYKYKRRSPQCLFCNKQQRQWHLSQHHQQKHTLPASEKTSTEYKQLAKKIPFYENIKLDKFLRIFILIMQQATRTHNNNTSNSNNNNNNNNFFCFSKRKSIAKIKTINNAKSKSPANLNVKNANETKWGVEENYHAAYKGANKDADINVDISDMASKISHQQHNYEKVSTITSTPIKCQRRKHHQIKATNSSLSLSSQSPTPTPTISLTTRTATLTMATLLSTPSVGNYETFQWTAILRHYVCVKPLIHQHHAIRMNSLASSRVFNINLSNNKHNNNNISSSSSSGTTASVAGAGRTSIYQSVDQYVNVTWNRSYTFSCLLLSLFIVFAIGIRSTTAGACWQTVLENGKCNEIFSFNISKSECCGANQEFAYTEREPTNVEYFFATAIGGGMECSPCLENCMNVKCGPNKKCVKRKGRPKCVCAPECGAARRKHRQKEHLMQQEQQQTQHHNFHLVSSRHAKEQNNKNDEDIYLQNVPHSSTRSSDAFKIKLEKSQQSRDTRSLSSEITNVNLGLENGKDAMIRSSSSGATSQEERHHCKEYNSNQRKLIHTHMQHAHGHGHPQQQQQQQYMHQLNHKNQKPKASRRLLITANAEYTEKPTTRRLQIFSNVRTTQARRRHNGNSNDNNNNNKNLNGQHEDTDPSNYDYEENDQDYNYNDAEEDAKEAKNKGNKIDIGNSNNNNRNDDSNNFPNQSPSRHKLKTKIKPNKNYNNNNSNNSNSTNKYKNRNKSHHNLQTTKIRQHSSNNSNNNNNTRVIHHAENTTHHRHHNRHHHRQQQQHQQQQQQQQERNHNIHQQQAQNHGRHKHNNNRNNQHQQQQHKQQSIVVKKPKNNKDYSITTTTNNTNIAVVTSDTATTTHRSKDNNVSVSDTDVSEIAAFSATLLQTKIVKMATTPKLYDLSLPSAANATTTITTTLNTGPQDTQSEIWSSAMSSFPSATPLNSAMSADDDGAAADDHYLGRLPNHGSQIAASSLLSKSSSSTTSLPLPSPSASASPSSYAQQYAVSARSSSKSLVVTTMSAEGEGVSLHDHHNNRSEKIPKKTIYSNNSNNNNNNDDIISAFEANLHNHQQQQQDQQHQTRPQSQHHYPTPLFDGLTEQFDFIGFPNKMQQQQVTTVDNVRPLHPVCGSDGRTYNTECQLRKRACRTDNPNLRIAYLGHCRTTCNGVKCLNGLTCVEDQYSMPHCIACKIECPQDDYDDVVDPAKAVCGADGKTYKSTCDINRMICKIGRSVGVAYPGPCREEQITCDDINCGSKQVCLIDLLTHHPRCTSCRYKCSRKRRPSSPYFDEGKICGFNNRTYNSWCEMRKDSCSTGFYIDVKYSGGCH